MDTQVIVVLAILGSAFLLFLSGRMKPDLIAMLVLVSLVLTQMVEPAQAFSGFSSFAVITIAGLMVIGHGLEITGVVKWVARRLEPVIKKRYGRLLMLNTAIPGVLSGFINIVAAASFFIPVVLRLCKKMEVAPSKILLPMACTALIGANLTLIGASHNLVVNSLLERETGAGFGFFEFTAVGAALLVAALIYIALTQALLPERREGKGPGRPGVTKNLIEVYGLEDRLFEIWVSDDIEDAEAIETLKDLELASHGVTVIALVREGETLVLPKPGTALEEGDMLLVQGRESRVEGFADASEALTFVGTPQEREKYPISTAELAEAVVPPRSPVIGKRIDELGLLESFGMTAIAYYRGGEPNRTNVHEVELQEGDSVLVYGPRDKMRDFEPEKDLLIYFKPGVPEVDPKLKRKAPLAACLLLAVILPAALGFLPIAATAVAGAVAMVMLGIVPLEDVYRAIDWKTLILIAGIYPLGVALNATGTAELIGETLIATLGDFGPLAVLGGVAALCMILTQPIHNAAVAVIMTPIAINAAEMMDSDPTGFCVGVVVACSTTFLMPYGHPAPLLVQDPGGYRPADYVKFGAGLNLIALGVILGLVPVLWPI